jgi:hypothetical protein
MRVCGDALGVGEIHGSPREKGMPVRQERKIFGRASLDLEAVNFNEVHNLLNLSSAREKNLMSEHEHSMYRGTSEACKQPSKGSHLTFPFD